MRVLLKISLAVALTFSVAFGYAQPRVVENQGNAVHLNTVALQIAKDKTAVIPTVDAASEVALSPVWFQYLAGDYDEPGSYQFLTASDGAAEDECEEGAQEICAIRVTPTTSGTPNETELDLLQDEIEQALLDGESSENVLLKNIQPNN